VTIVSVRGGNTNSSLELKPAPQVSRKSWLNMLLNLQRLNVSNWLAAEGLVLIPKASALRTEKAYISFI